MNNFFKKWQQKTQERNGVLLLQDEAKRVFKSLRFIKPNKLNEAANIHHHTFFNQFSCLQCANCCKGIPPIVNETDAVRIAKYLRMKVLEFRESYTRLDEDGDRVMMPNPCAFLESDNSCRIYTVRPKACREYPHTDSADFSKHIAIHIANAGYCPAVAHLVSELDKRFKRV